MTQEDNNSIGVWCCPICHGTGNIKRPHGMQKDMNLKRDHAKKLKEQGYSIREICVIMGYKSPRSVQDLLSESTAENIPSKCDCPDDQCLLGDHPSCRWVQYNSSLQ